jgi:hypothetical protein
LLQNIAVDYLCDSVKFFVAYSLYVIV